MTIPSSLPAQRSHLDQIENELPQPQEEAAFGLRIWNEAPIRSSTKSISAPLSRSSEVSSTMTPTPSRSNRASSGFCWSSKLRPYWKPEQPPPDTAMRGQAPWACSCSFRKAMRRAALSVTWIRRSPISLAVSAISPMLPKSCGSPATVFRPRHGLVKSPRQALNDRRRCGPVYWPGSRSRRNDAARRRRRSGPGATTGATRQARLSEGAGAKGAVAVDLDDPQRQSPAAEPRRAQGRRAPGVELVGGDADDRALSRCHAAAGPGRGEAARGAGVSRAAIPARAPEPRQAGAVPRPRRRAILPVADQGRRHRRFFDRLGRTRGRGDAVRGAGAGLPAAEEAGADHRGA